MLALAVHPSKGFECILRFNFAILASEGSFELLDDDPVVPRNGLVLLSDLKRITQNLFNCTRRVEILNRMEAAWAEARVGDYNLDVDHRKHEEKCPEVVSSDLLERMLEQSSLQPLLHRTNAYSRKDPRSQMSVIEEQFYNDHVQSLIIDRRRLENSSNIPIIMTSIYAVHLY